MNLTLAAQVCLCLLCLVVYENAAVSADLPRIGPVLNQTSEFLRSGFHYGGEAIARASSMILYLKLGGLWETCKELIWGVWALLWSFRGIFEGYAAESRRQAEPGWIAVGSLVLYVVVNNAWMYVTGQKPLLTILGIALGKTWLAMAGRLGMRRRQVNYDSDSSDESSSEEESSEEDPPPKKRQAAKRNSSTVKRRPLVKPG